MDDGDEEVVAVPSKIAAKLLCHHELKQGRFLLRKVQSDVDFDTIHSSTVRSNSPITVISQSDVIPLRSNNWNVSTAVTSDESPYPFDSFDYTVSGNGSMGSIGCSKSRPIPSAILPIMESSRSLNSSLSSSKSSSTSSLRVESIRVVSMRPRNASRQIVRRTVEDALSHI